MMKWRWKKCPMELRILTCLKEMETLSFNDVSDTWGTGKMKGYYNGASYADLDNDGNLDLVINCIDAPAVDFKEQCTKEKLIFRFHLKEKAVNTLGVGCKAYVFQTRQNAVPAINA